MKLLIPDYIIAIAFILICANYSITQYLIAQHTTVAETLEESKQLITYVEQNPVAVFIFKFEKFRLMYQRFFLPGIYFGFYYFLRKRYKDNPDMLTMFSFMILSFFLLNFFNDVGYLLGFLL